MDNTLRTFIAVELEPPLQQSLKNIQDHLKPLNLDVSWVKPSNIHITLKFLGEIPLKKVKAIQEIFPDISRDIKPFAIELAGLGVFPRIERPNVIWVGIDKGSDETKRLAEAVENAVCRLGYPKERREFTTHLTLGRVKSLKNCGSLAQAVKDYSPTGSVQQMVNQIIFFKSTLSSQGSIYEPLATARLS